jgi:hypothetical protein
LGGGVEFSENEFRVNTCDNNGAGSECFYPSTNRNAFTYEYFDYWCEKGEIDVPFKEERLNQTWVVTMPQIF